MNPQVLRVQQPRRPTRVSLPAISLNPSDLAAMGKKKSKRSPLAELSPTTEGNYLV